MICVYHIYVYKYESCVAMWKVVLFHLEIQQAGNKVINLSTLAQIFSDICVTLNWVLEYFQVEKQKIYT